MMSRKEIGLMASETQSCACGGNGPCQCGGTSCDNCGGSGCELCNDPVDSEAITFRAAEPRVASCSSHGIIENEVTVITGSERYGIIEINMCQYCYGEWLATNFPVTVIE